MAEPAIDAPLRRLAIAIGERSTTAVSLARQAIEHHNEFGGPLNGYRHWDEADILARAQVADKSIISGGGGALAGIPVSVKDIYGLDGMPLFGGMAREIPQPWRNEGPVIRALRDSGAVFTGKTHATELALGAVGHNIHLDSPPRNPWDDRAHRLCGGSSIGAAVSIAEGSAVVAMGSDTGGSVRNPASLVGCVGFKPTHGRWSNEGLLPASPAFDTPGVLTRTAEDAAFAFAVLDPSACDPDRFFARHGDLPISEFRIGVVEDYFWDKCDPSVASVVRAAIDELAHSGAQLREVPLPEAAQSRNWYTDTAIFAVESLSFLRERYPDRLATVDPLTAERFASLRDIDASSYYTGLRKIADLAASADLRLRDVDVIVTPTLPIGAPLLSDMADLDAYREANFLIGYNTQPINLLGLCTMTLPVGLDRQRLPVGLQLAAPAMHDERLLAAAMAVENVLGTSKKRLGIPPMCAT
jgi:aspartyl-tRNA(Asn)/glutamyl-tRNA(Gln) amidotransferase subunit A